jgi:hypothetical protein
MTGATGAAYNVAINVKGLANQASGATLRSQSDDLGRQAETDAETAGQGVITALR